MAVIKQTTPSRSSPQPPDAGAPAARRLCIGVVLDDMDGE